MKQYFVTAKYFLAKSAQWNFVLSMTIFLASILSQYYFKVGGNFFYLSLIPLCTGVLGLLVNIQETEGRKVSLSGKLNTDSKKE